MTALRTTTFHFNDALFLDLAEFSLNGFRQTSRMRRAGKKAFRVLG